jgi:hypothetical protein
LFQRCGYFFAQTAPTDSARLAVQEVSVSFTLDSGTRPEGLSVVGLWDCILIHGDGLPQIRISMIDLLCLTEYALTNSDLLKGEDPRLAFVRHVKDMHVGKGLSPDCKKLLPNWTSQESFLIATHEFQERYAASMKEMESREGERSPDNSTGTAKEVL